MPPFDLHYFSLLYKMLQTMILLCLILCLLVVVTALILRYLLQRRAKQIKANKGWSNNRVVGFFHPYCNAGGGGERVLWVAIKAIHNKYPDVKCVVYTGDCDATGDQILAKARQRFNITISKPVEFVFLKTRSWVQAERYPVFTLLGQSLGSVVLGMEALMKFVPDIYIDSMGYAFTIPVFKYLGSCKVGCYVHYPTISTDMLQRVSRREQAFNNTSVVSRSSFLTSIKVLYYRMFAYVYGIAGARSDFVFVNSTWTHGHIRSLWCIDDRTFIVYPPCDISEFIQIDLNKNRNKNNVKSILSIAQFRPEKNHQLQLESFSKFLDDTPDTDKPGYKLLLVGGCRDDGDAQRVEQLKQIANKLDIQDYVEFRLNVPFEELKQLMGEASIGLHTMRDEHFGIGVVEMMAAGTVTLAHDSGGPKLDILTPYDGAPTGYLASDISTYADAMHEIFKLPKIHIEAICENARRSVTRFSEQEFEHGFMSVMDQHLR